MNSLCMDMDVGNTAIKWRVAGKDVTRGGGFPADDLAQLELLLDELLPSRIRIACVRDAFYKERLLRVFSQKNLRSEFAESTLACAGLLNGYATPETLGVDRWLAALAVWNEISAQKSACLVIDAGSAITIDTVDESGVFLGGYIVPGVGMMQRSLVGGTGGIHCEIMSFADEVAHTVPNDTAGAVQQGAMFAACAVIDKAIAEFLSRWPHGTVRLTGGDGGGIAAVLGLADQYRENMVLDGLYLALP